MITKELLEAHVTYEPETGKMFWRPYPDKGKSWNTRLAGKEVKGKAGRYLRLRFTENSIQYSMPLHHAVWFLETGSWVEGTDLLIHKDGDYTNNHISNLYVDIPSKVIMRNAETRANSSGKRGVRKHRHNRWQAFIKLNDKHIHLGNFDNYEDAVQARLNAEKKYGF